MKEYVRCRRCGHSMPRHRGSLLFNYIRVKWEYYCSDMPECIARKFPNRKK